MNELTLIIQELKNSEKLEPFQIFILEMIETELNDLRSIKKRAKRFLEVCESDRQFKPYIPILKLILFGEGEE